VFGESDTPADYHGLDEAFDLLQELERNTSDQIRRQRAYFRVAVKSTIILRPANASERPKLQLQGVTGDISEEGCKALFPVPVGVGDVYQLEFDRDMLPLPSMYARCLRCRLLREDAFEAGFSFFAPISLPENVLMQLSAASPDVRQDES